MARQIPTFAIARRRALSLWALAPTRAHAGWEHLRELLAQQLATAGVPEGGHVAVALSGDPLPATFPIPFPIELCFRPPPPCHRETSHQQQNTST